MAKVLILAGDAAEDLETMFIKYRLAEADLRAARGGADVAADQARRARLRAGLGHLRRTAGPYLPGRRHLRRGRPGRVRRRRHPRRAGAGVHPHRPRRGPDRRALLLRGEAGRDAVPRPPGARRARSPSRATQLGLRTARARPRARRSASTWTAPPSSTATWSRAAAGATSPSGRRRSWTCSTGQRSRSRNLTPG